LSVSRVASHVRPCPVIYAHVELPRKLVQVCAIRSKVVAAVAYVEIVLLGGFPKDGGEGGIESLIAEPEPRGRPALVCLLFSGRHAHLNEEAKFMRLA
jgi:hypothetical protein